MPRMDQEQPWEFSCGVGKARLGPKMERFAGQFPHKFIHVCEIIRRFAVGIFSAGISIHK